LTFLLCTQSKYKTVHQAVTHPGAPAGKGTDTDVRKDSDVYRAQIQVEMPYTNFNTNIYKNQKSEFAF